MISPELAEKRDALLADLRRYRRVAVAFSGGVDSAVVAKAAALACGEQALAVTAVSPSLANGELETARRVAEEIGIRHATVRTDEFAQSGYRANAGNRCYFCKNELYDVLAQRLVEWQVDVICNGANVDDLGDYRPGMQAAREHDVRSPLIDAGLNKQDVRELAYEWQLPVWDKPAAPCLSSRIAYGVEVTPERVRRVDLAEKFLREQFQLREFRVRLEAGELARIEVPTSAFLQLIQPESRAGIVAKLHELGFRYITLDLEGFRSGSLNQALTLVDLNLSTSSADGRET